VSEAPLSIVYLHRTRSKDGQNVHIESLIGGLRELGHRIELVQPKAMDSAAFGDEGGLVSRLKRALPRALYEALEATYQAVEFVKLATHCLRSRPDAIYQRANLHMLSGAAAARLLRIPLLVEVNAPLAEERGAEPGLALPGLARWSERRLWRAADRLLPVSHVLARRLADAGIDPARITVVANGVDPAAFEQLGDAAAAKRALGIAPDRLVIGFVGFVRPWHGTDRIVRFLASPAAPPHAHFLLVGDGPARASLSALARELGVEHKVTITGVMAREAVPAAIAACDIAVLPDVVEYACPLKLIEYMAMGRAIVAPDKPNIRELVGPEREALLVAPSDTAALHQALARLAGDPALRARLGAAARAAVTAKGLTWQSNARTVADIVRQLKRAR